MNSKYASQSGCNRCCGCCICEGSSQNVIICHDLTTAQQKHSRLTLNKLLIAFTASINTEPVSIQCLIKNLPNKQCPLETETKESNNEWRRSRSWRMMTFWLLSSHIQQQHGHPRHFKFKRKYQQYDPCFYTIFHILMTIVLELVFKL